MAVFKGAKYDPKTKIGLEYRSVSVRDLEGGSAFAHLLALVQNGEFVVPAPTKKAGEELLDIEGSFRNAMNCAGKKFLKKNKAKLSLSPYCFRHGFCSDMKAMSANDLDIAAAMGHASTKTQVLYGRAAGGNKLSRSVIVDASVHDIRHVVKDYSLIKVTPKAPAPNLYNRELDDEMAQDNDPYNAVESDGALPLPHPYLHLGRPD